MNNFRNYLTAENKLQEAVVKYLKLKYPKVLFTHPMNEGKRGNFEKYLVRILGMSKGVPDLLIFEPISKYHGLAIELKVGSGRATQQQERWLRELHRKGWRAKVCRGLDEAMKEIDDYFALKDK